MSEYDPEPRSAGPALVARGRLVHSAILVLDPAGAAKHDDVPASWHPMSLEHLLLWCRIPADTSLAEADRALSELARQNAVVDVLTSGPAAGAAMDLAERNASSVRSVLLVDPAAPHDHFGGPEAAAADERWADAARDRMAELQDAGIDVRIVAHSCGGGRDRVPPPLPLGHPDLVELVRTAITELDAETETNWGVPGGEGDRA